jgi:DNA-binding MarR family transcriptional regulator
VTNFSDTDEKGQTWMLLDRTHKVLERVRETELNKLGITPIEAKVLDALKTAAEPVTPAKLSRWLYREPHSVSGLLNRMVIDGLVRKSKDLGKKNLVRVSLTHKGEEALKQLGNAGAIVKITSHLTKRERDTLERCLQRLQAEAFEVLRELQPYAYS